MEITEEHVEICRQETEKIFKEMQDAFRMNDVGDDATIMLRLWLKAELLHHETKREHIRQKFGSYFKA